MSDHARENVLSDLLGEPRPQGPPVVPIMRGDLFIYLSGPMTAKHGYTVEENVLQGLRAHLDLLQRGIPNFCPHLGWAFPSAWSQVDWETWLRYDLAVIDRCTHVLLLPRWETSAGALKEKAYAEAKGVPVLMGDHELARVLLESAPMTADEVEQL